MLEANIMPGGPYVNIAGRGGGISCQGSTGGRVG